MSINNEYLLKICAIGSGNVEKTRLIRKYAENKFEANYLPTLGVDITTKRIVVNKKPVKLILVDTAGQEFFGKLRPSYYRGASACTILFNQNDRRSFEAVPNWLKEFSKYIPLSVPVALVCITSDCEEVSSEEGQCLAEVLNCGYFECTLKNGPQLAKVFTFLAHQALEEPEKQDSLKIRLPFSQTDKDIQIVTCLLLPEFHKSKKTRFSREDVLDLWVQQERFLGNKKAESFLRNRLLRPRLTSLIKSLQKVPNAHLSIAFTQPKRGRPKVLLVLNKRD
jgi:small GTP-binding protein